ncbi:MAG: hypothetical protein ACTHN0_19380 [Aquihabitans sp.]
MNHHRVANAALGLGLAGSLLLGACSSGDPADVAKTTTTAPAAAPERGEIPELEDARGAYRSLDVSSCERGPGAVDASGTFTNESKKRRDVVVVVSWVSPKGNGVLARDVAVLQDLGPGKSAGWKVAGRVRSKTKATCAFTVTSGTLP